MDWFGFHVVAGNPSPDGDDGNLSYLLTGVPDVLNGLSLHYSFIEYGVYFIELLLAESGPLVLLVTFPVCLLMRVGGVIVGPVFQTSGEMPGTLVADEVFAI